MPDTIHATQAHHAAVCFCSLFRFEIGLPGELGPPMAVFRVACKRKQSKSSTCIGQSPAHPLYWVIQSGTQECQNNPSLCARDLSERESDALDDERDALSDANAHGAQGVAPAAAL